jgi:multidrug efflux pump subunit AcrA (membrane-fusion protein)
MVSLAPFAQASNWSNTAPAQVPYGIPAQQMAPIAMVESGTLGASVAISGTVVAFKQVLLTAQLPGRVEYIAGTEGDKFGTDEVLVAIDDDDLLAKRRAALAQLSTAQAAISNAQMQYSRELYSPQSRSITRSGGMGMPSLFDQMFTQPMMSSFMPGNIGGNRWVDRQADLHGYGTQLSQAQSQYASVRSQLDEIDAKLRDARSFAPFDGVIVKKLVEQGDTVSPGQGLLEFADLSYLQIQVDVPSRLMPGLSKGMLVPARLDVGNTQVQARVAQIFPTADALRHTVTVKFDLPVGVAGNPGMYAEVLVPDVSVPVNSVPAIPDSAVIWRGSLPAVFVVGEDGQPSLRLIRLGSYLGPGRVSVLSGLRIGERIYAVPPDNKRSAWGGSGQAQ